MGAHEMTKWDGDKIEDWLKQNPQTPVDRRRSFYTVAVVCTMAAAFAVFVVLDILSRQFG